jgi:hypothetical protein
VEIGGKITRRMNVTALLENGETVTAYITPQRRRIQPKHNNTAAMDEFQKNLAILDV